MDYGLLGIDPAIAQQFALPEEERRKLLLANALMGLGAGFANQKRGDSWINSAAGGLAAGGMMGQRAIQSARDDRFNSFKQAATAQEFANKKKGQEQSAADQAELGNMLGGSPKGDEYRKAAAFYSQRGMVDQAEKMMKLAQSFDKEYSTTPQVVRGPDGRPQIVQLSKTGDVKETGLSPAEKLHFGSTGGQTNVGFDPYSGAPMSQGMPATMTPGEAESKKLGWANFGLAKNADARAAVAAAEGGKPHFDATTGQFVYPPTADAPKGRAVKPEGYEPKPPEHTRRELDSIDAQLGIVAGAKKAAQDTPKAFSVARGMATMAGALPESLAGQMDSEPERAARAYVYNVVSSVINERAGAAQSVQELARLRSFLPAETDSAKQVQGKLSAFETYLHDKRKAYAGAGKSAPATVDFSALPK